MAPPASAPPDPASAVRNLKEMASGFRAKEFTIKGTRFRISKLLPEEGFEVSEILREGLGARLATIGATASIETAVAAMFLSLPAATVERVRQRLFEEVYFKNKLTNKQWLNLAQERGMGFTDLEPLHVYEVLMRALVVNFLESLLELPSRFPILNRASSPPGTQT